MAKNDAPNIDLVIQVVSDCLNSTAFRIERVLRGVSTYVYRVQFGMNNFYLRILPEADMSFGAEVYVHSLLREIGVQVPEVIHYEHHNRALGMSLMLLKEIHGSSVSDCSSIDEYEGILFEAGKQIALINQIKVDGFGWIIRDKAEYSNTLRGEKSALHHYIYEFLEKDLSLLNKKIFSKGDTSQIKSIINSGIELMVRHDSNLIHGDFDDSHIFQQAGKYTGMIDFGEIQGNSPLYDLGHFKIHDGQYRTYLGYSSLAKGYNEVRCLSDNDQLEIDLWAIWIGVRRLGMVCQRPWGEYHEHLIKAVKIEMDILK